MSKPKTYLAILPFWPLAVARSQNYFLNPLLAAKKLGYKTLKLINPSFDQVLNQLQAGQLVHFHSTYRSVFKSLSFSLLKNQSAKLIWTPYLSFNQKNQTTLPYHLIKFLKPLLKKLDRIITITPYEHRYLRSLGYRNLDYLPLCIDTQRLPRAKLGLEPQPRPLNLLFFGGERPIKNLLPVLKAVKILNQLKLQPQLHILDSAKPSFIKQHKKFIGPKIKFYGRLPHLSTKFKKLLSQPNYYINNSLAEGSPLAAYEAAFSGLNCCLSSLPTLKSLFPETALFHHPNRPDQLVRNLLLYYFNPCLAWSHRRTNYIRAQLLSRHHFQKKFSQILKRLA
jgi:glycosyltransferase involved in cell wall biosynthesis